MGVPIPVFLLGLFTSGIQALVFATLAAAYLGGIDSAMNHHLAGLFGLGSLAWAGHIIHVSMPTQAVLLGGVDPQLVPAPH